IAGGGAYRVASDEIGVLWRQRWRWEAWAAVEVMNGTPEQDGTYKRYYLQVPANMRTAREAGAWASRVSEERYQPSVRDRPAVEEKGRPRRISFALATEALTPYPALP